VQLNRYSRCDESIISQTIRLKVWSKEMLKLTERQFQNTQNNGIRKSQ
jgi:hypothetical protein